MSDINKRLFAIERQRNELQKILQDSRGAIVVAIGSDGALVTAYMGLNQIERRGMIELLHDTVPRFYALVSDEDN